MAYLLYKYLRDKRNRKREAYENELNTKQGAPNVTPSHGDEAHENGVGMNQEVLDVTPSHRENDTGIHDPVEAPLKSEKSVTSEQIDDSDKKRRRRYRWKLVLGLLLPFSVQSLDVTIIAGALPFIASDFNQLSQLNWIISAFNLTAATFIPAWGQVADIFGRYRALQTAIVTMVIGSALCAGAPVTAFAMLLVGRALQGIGCAGLMIITKIVLADKVSLSENAKNNTIFALVGGLGYAIGPVLGGYLTQANWRLCFAIPGGIGLIGLVSVHFILRSELLGPQAITRSDGVPESQETRPTFLAKIATIDFGGQILFLFGMGLLVLALTWAGSYYPWSDIKVIIPLVVGSLLLVLFLVWENFMMPGSALATRYPHQKAMIPLKLIISRNAGLLIYINLVTGMAMYAVFYFVDLYFALVLNYTPGDAGRNLLYYMPGIGVGTYIAMFSCNFYPRQTWFPLAFGTVIEPLGLTLLAVALKSGNLPLVYGMLALTGVGTGVRFMPGTLHGVGYFPKQIASIVSLMSLAVNLGGTLSTTIMLNVFNNDLGKAGYSFSSSSSSSLDAISSLSSSDQSSFREQAKSSIALSFFAISAFMWLGVVAVCGLGNVNIAKGGKEKDSVGGEATGGSLVKGSFLGSLLHRRSRREGGEAS